MTTRPRLGSAARLWQVVVAGAVPWLGFEAVFLLAPVWAPDESTSIRGVLATATFYAAVVGGPGVAFGAVTRSRGLLIAGTLALTGTAVWAAVEMLTSGDGQAGLAVFAIWYVGVPLILLAALVARIPSRHASTLATVLVVALAFGTLGAAAAGVTEPTREAADAKASARGAARRIRAVVSTGAVAAPPGGSMFASVRCSRRGDPAVDFELSSAGEGPRAGEALTARLRAAGWEVRERGEFHDSFKRFGHWTARLSELARAPDGRSVTVHLDVDADAATDCSTFRDELRGTFRSPGRGGLRPA